MKLQINTILKVDRWTGCDVGMIRFGLVVSFLILWFVLDAL